MFLSEEKILDLEKKANDIRISIIEMLVEAGSGHTAGPLGMADIFTLFYFHILRQDPKNPTLPGTRSCSAFKWTHLSGALFDYGSCWIFSC